MCFSTAKWQREEVQDHKFDFVDVNEFHDTGILRRLKYSVLFMVVIKSILVYVADMWTAGILIIFDRWNTAVQPKIPFAVSKWIFVGCIIVSFLLLAWDIKKARHIIKTRDISYAFTSTIAYRFYTLRSYKHYNFFCQINNSKKKADEIAFFVFFTFKAPRQVINAITLVSIIQSNKKKQYLDINSYGENMVQQLAMGTMVFTLKTEQRVKQRKQEADAEARGDFSHLKNKRGIDNETRPLRQPTLPTFEFSDEKKQSFSPYGQMPPLPPPNFNNQVEPVMGIPPYGPRSGAPRVGTPSIRNGNPGYGPPPPFMGRRNSNSSISSDMTGFSAYSSTTHQLTGPGLSVRQSIMMTNETIQNRNSQRFSIFSDEYYGGAFDDAYNSNDQSSRIRSHSPTPSISSTTSGRARLPQSRAVVHPAVNSRYQEQRGPRYNNYAEQGGGQSRTDGLY
ncbi:10294_t:CDS:2 [Diversispora eburnea]|uniref:10294_t:CDS:1 n=1 Tax=Diversispora eburnea TaxID=1213867 RepID=A0A9N8YSN5_9GLOM|nr:10294_t:CDS:2 [Diversispora eburnea]